MPGFGEFIMEAADGVLRRITREFLMLQGADRHPPVAASVDLVFSRAGSADERVVIPAGTRAEAGAVVFATAWATALEAGQQSVGVRAYHGEFVAGELAGTASGRPGQVLWVARRGRRR